jgi:hypothetical protein
VDSTTDITGMYVVCRVTPCSYFDISISIDASRAIFFCAVYGSREYGLERYRRTTC